MRNKSFLVVVPPRKYWKVYGSMVSEGCQPLQHGGRTWCSRRVDHNSCSLFMERSVVESQTLAKSTNPGKCHRGGSKTTHEGDIFSTFLQGIWEKTTRSLKNGLRLLCTFRTLFYVPARLLFLEVFHPGSVLYIFKGVILEKHNFVDILKEGMIIITIPSYLTLGKSFSACFLPQRGHNFCEIKIAKVTL